MADKARRAAKLREMRDRYQAADKPDLATSEMHFEQVGPMLYLGGFRPGTLISIDPRLKTSTKKN